MRNEKIVFKEIVFYIIIPIVTAVIGALLGAASSNIYYEGNKMTYDELASIINGRDELNRENIKLTSEIKNKDDSLLTLQNENRELQNQLQSIRGQLKDIKYLKKSLSVNGIPMNFVGDVVEIDDVSFFGEEFIKYLADNENLGVSGSTINVGVTNTNLPSSLLSVSNPYDVTGDIKYDGNVVLNMEGKTYDNGMKCSTWAGGGMSFALNKKYQTLMFDIGHIDDSNTGNDFVFSIYLDGEKERTITISPKNPVQSFVVNLNYAKTLRFEWGGSLAPNPTIYGFVNINVS